MAERSKALLSGRILYLKVWVRIPLLTWTFIPDTFLIKSFYRFRRSTEGELTARCYFEFILLLCIVRMYNAGVAERYLSWGHTKS